MNCQNSKTYISQLFLFLIAINFFRLYRIIASLQSSDTSDTRHSPSLFCIRFSRGRFLICKWKSDNNTTNQLQKATIFKLTIYNNIIVKKVIVHLYVYFLAFFLSHLYFHWFFKVLRIPSTCITIDYRSKHAKKNI